jgi:glycosyltransferase involved in cell wall biosynthesis
MISIIIPTFNNLNYLKLCIHSLKKNSFYKNEILLHINEGTDGTIEYAKKNDLIYSHSKINDGLCVGCNKIAKKTSKDYILYSHDDMYFLPNWDLVLMNEVKSLNTKNFYLSSIMINGDPRLNGHLNLDAGDTIYNFNENYLLENYKKLKHPDFQGSTWAPHLIHRELWDDVGGFSEEFSPGIGSDPDLNMKLWNNGVRIFKCLGESKVYHFGSITIRKKGSTIFKKNQGSLANKIFLLKWGVSIKFFKKHYLRSNYLHNKNLNEPQKNISYYKDLFKDKILFFFYKIFTSI